MQGANKLLQILVRDLVRCKLAFESPLDLFQTGGAIEHTENRVFLVLESKVA